MNAAPNNAFACSFIRTGQFIEQGTEEFPRLYEAARGCCADLFVAEETREFDAVRGHISLGFVLSLRNELAAKLTLPPGAFSIDRFSIHGCGPVGLHDDFFRYPRFHFVIVVVHSGMLGLVDAQSRAVQHLPGEIILLDPRRKHGLLPEGITAEEHVYETTHSAVYDPERQFMFVNFDLHRSVLRARFRACI
jgi:hypothetical protein